MTRMTFKSSPETTHVVSLLGADYNDLCLRLCAQLISRGLLQIEEQAGAEMPPKNDLPEACMNGNCSHRRVPDISQGWICTLRHDVLERWRRQQRVLPLQAEIVRRM